MADLNHLTGMLRRFVPGDEVESAYHRRMLELTGYDPASGGNDSLDYDPFSRKHFEPGHFTASCFILSRDLGSLLLIHHTKLGRWLQPGGHIEGEDGDVIAAARREAEEEVGLGASQLYGPVQPMNLNPTRRATAGYSIVSIFDLDIHPIPAHGEEPEHEHFDVRFLFVAQTERIESGEGVKDARWVALGEIDGRVNGDESVLRAVRKLREGLALPARSGVA